MSRLLLVDDDDEIVRTLSISLRARGYEIVVAHDGAGALRQAASTTPELVILDLGLPDLDGINVITSLRHQLNVPILILSGRSDLTNKIDALDAGADDYLTKPFSLDELLARLRALARRRSVDLDSVMVTLGHVTVDLHGHTVTERVGRTTKEIHLTATEWLLLEVMLRHPGQLMSRRKLLGEVWGSGYPEDSNHLRVYMARLRAKLERDPTRPRYLVNEHGVGYRFQP